MMTRNVVLLLVSLTVEFICRGGMATEHHRVRQVAYSANGKFYAVSEPRDEETTVFSIKQNMEDRQKVWSFSGNCENFHVSENGLVLAAMPHEWSRVHISQLTKENLRAATVLVFHHADGHSVELKLDRVFKDPKKLKPSDYEDDYNWGTVVGFDEENHLVMDTLEKHRIVIDPNTAAIVSDEDHNPKK